MVNSRAIAGDYHQFEYISSKFILNVNNSIVDDWHFHKNTNLIFIVLAMINRVTLFSNHLEEHMLSLHQ